MKKFQVISSLALCCALAIPLFANAQSESVTNHGKQIADKYGIGERLSEADLNYVLTHGIKAEKANGKKLNTSKVSPMAAVSNWSIAGSARNSDRTVEGDLLGSFTADIGYINNSVYGNMKASTVKGNVTSTKASFRYVAYGPISTESPYVGKVADWTQSASGTTSANLKISKNFTASVTAWTSYPEAEMQYPGGVLNIAATPTKQ